MRRAFYALPLLVFAISAPTKAETTQDRQADEKQLRHIKSTLWPGYYRDQNIDGLRDFLASSFVNIGPDGSAVEKDEELAALAGDPWNPVNFRYVVDRLDWHGEDLVTITGRGMSERTNRDGSTCLHSYASSNLLRRAEATKAGWQALSSHVSGVECNPLD
ncbi:DUF4440 domain-containing protein [Parasphingorhabdus sp.]|uniref:DUF4440 domain-containing protein n=1 Tax=Parasphingorhabdus sp. TaxID=2709688 RepID=UPI003A919870